MSASRAAPERALPATLQIGACQYKVVVSDQLRGEGNEALLGRCEYCDGTLSLQSGTAPDAEFVTLWHEVLHGILSNAGYSKSHPESLIDAIAHGIVQVLRENPYMRGR